MLFIGYSLEDDNILEIIKTVRACIGENMKSMFLVAPNLPSQKSNQLKSNKVAYIDACADEVLTSVITAIKDYIAYDVRHNDVSKETYDKFVELNADIYSTIRKTEDGNVIEDLTVRKGQKREDTIQFTISNEIKEELEQRQFNDKITVIGSSITVPALKISADKMIKFSHYVNGIKFNGKEDISCLYVAPVINKQETKLKMQSIKFAESVIFVKYIQNNVVHIDIEAPICYIRFELHIGNNKVCDVSSIIESKDTYTNNTEALKWIDALIALNKKGQKLKLDGLELTVNHTNKKAIAEYKKVKEYYTIIRNIENETNVTFSSYNQYSEKNYLNALYLYHYLTGKGFRREVPKNARLTFVIDTRDENNLPIEKFQTDTFVMLQCDPLGQIELNGKQFMIPYRTTAFMDCRADNITALNEHEYEIVMLNAQNNYLTWCSDTKPEHDGNTLHIGNKRVI